MKTVTTLFTVLEQRILHHLALCHKSRLGYNCHGRKDECGKAMTLKTKLTKEGLL